MRRHASIRGDSPRPTSRSARRAERRARDPPVRKTAPGYDLQSQNGIHRLSGRSPHVRCEPMTRRERLLREFGKWDVREGSPGPLGASWVEPLKSWNFALYSRRATGVTLLLYGEKDSVNPIREIVLNPRMNKSGRIWHCWVSASDAPGACRYAYRINGPYDPRSGYRFDSSKILLD